MERGRHQAERTLHCSVPPHAILRYRQWPPGFRQFCPEAVRFRAERGRSPSLRLLRKEWRFLRLRAGVRKLLRFPGGFGLRPCAVRVREWISHDRPMRCEVWSGCATRTLPRKVAPLRQVVARAECDIAFCRRSRMEFRDSVERRSATLRRLLNILRRKHTVSTGRGPW